MEKETIWAMYFAGVAAMRFHPRNIDPQLNGYQDWNDELHKRIELELWYASIVADEMTRQHNRRFPWAGDHSSEG